MKVRLLLTLACIVGFVIPVNASFEDVGCPLPVASSDGDRLLLEPAKVDFP